MKQITGSLSEGAYLTNIQSILLILWQFQVQIGMDSSYCNFIFGNIRMSIDKKN